MKGKFMGDESRFEILNIKDISLPPKLPDENAINEYLAKKGNIWRLKLSNATLWFEEKTDDDYVWYEIDLDRCSTSAQVLDWIAQVEGKMWATDRILAGLVRALDLVLSLQPTLCSFGVERGPVTWKERLAKK